MTKQPTPEDIENSPDLQAMQALIQAESTPTCESRSLSPIPPSPS
jgi:hypothetical protein